MRPPFKIRALFTDLDGTLFGNNLDLKPTLPLLETLKMLKVPVIPVTSKTLGEVIALSREAPLAVVYDKGFLSVSEMGGCIHASKGLLSTNIKPLPTEWEGILEYPLAIPLESIEQRVGRVVELSGCKARVDRVSHMDPRDFSEKTGIPLEHARMAVVRKYDEVLIPSDPSCVPRIVRAARMLGLDAVAGKLHVHVGKGIGKERALRILAQSTPLVFGPSVLENSLCLGDAPIDWGFLELCGVRGVVPSGHGRGLSVGVRGNYLVAPWPAPRGWSWIVGRTILLRDA